jgi:transglutaminase-like putative cysteine protease
MLFVLRPLFTSNLSLIEERRIVSPFVPIEKYIDSYGNEVWRLVAPVERLQIEYDALVTLSSTPDLVFPDLRKTAVENLPYDVIVYTLPSRLCPSDLFVNDAWRLFGQIQGGWEQVQAVCDWLHSNILYGVGSTSSTSAWDAYQERRGVCRDFAHLGIAFCRALNFPARYVCGYLPDINVAYDPAPMDFHAWFEVYIDGLWCTFDARHNYPRIGRVPIARGRDAVDVAFSTVYGSTQLVSMKVWADQVDELLSLSSVLPENNY